MGSRRDEPAARARSVTPPTAAGRPIADAYDTVLAHEHIAIDITCWLDRSHAPTRALADLEVTDDHVDAIRRNPFACRANLVLDDPDLAERELDRLAPFGRTLLVDVTPTNVGRDVPLLVALDRARDTLDIAYGCGRYIAVSRPGDGDLTVDAYREEILAEIHAPDGPRPAVIGEIGTSDPIDEMERRSVTGAAQAQAATGAALYLHVDPWGRNAVAVLDLALRAGADPQRTVVCHMDASVGRGLDVHRALMDRGARIGFDIWGDEDAYGDLGMPTDTERLAALVTLIGEGYGDRIVHSQDVCTRTQLRRFGGPGYAHLPEYVAPRMAVAGMAPPEIARQLAGNALAVVRGRGDAA